MASRILGMGDVLSLIEKAEQSIDQDKAKEMEQTFKESPVYVWWLSGIYGSD